MSWLAHDAEPFHAESVNKADFQFKQCERQQPIRPRDEIERTPVGAFAGESSNHDAYKAWQPQARYRHQQPAYQKPEGSMDMSTTYGNQFVNGKAYVRLPPIRPESQHRQQPQQQQDTASGTEQSDSYPGYYRRAQLADAKQPSCKPARAYRPPEAPFEARSSYAGDFASAASLPADRAKPVRHQDQLRLSGEPMESRGGVSSSTYGAGAAEAGGGRRQPIVPRGELAVASGAPFAVETTQRGDFAARACPRREAIRPAGELELSRDPMAVATTSRDVYTPKARDEPPPMRRKQPQIMQTAGQVAG